MKTPAGRWKAVVRKHGWPTVAKTFRTKRDAEDWSRRTEDEMVRGVYIERGASERMLFGQALDRYLAEVTPTKRPSTQRSEQTKAKPVRAFFARYALAAINSDLVAQYRDRRLSEGKRADTVRLELALLGHLFTTAIREWRIGLVQNPVANVRKPAAPGGRNRRLTPAEEGACPRFCVNGSQAGDCRQTRRHHESTQARCTRRAA